VITGIAIQPLVPKPIGLISDDVSDTVWHQTDQGKMPRVPFDSGTPAVDQVQCTAVHCQIGTQPLGPQPFGIISNDGFVIVLHHSKLETVPRVPFCSVVPAAARVTTREAIRHIGTQAPMLTPIEINPNEVLDCSLQQSRQGSLHRVLFDNPGSAVDHVQCTGVHCHIANHSLVLKCVLVAQKHL